MVTVLGGNAVGSNVNTIVVIMMSVETVVVETVVGGDHKHGAKARICYSSGIYILLMRLRGHVDNIAQEKFCCTSSCGDGDVLLQQWEMFVA